MNVFCLERDNFPINADAGLQCLKPLAFRAHCGLGGNYRASLFLEYKVADRKAFDPL